jgi:hypothetical protein
MFIPQRQKSYKYIDSPGKVEYEGKQSAAVRNLSYEFKKLYRSILTMEDMDKF